MNETVPTEEVKYPCAKCGTYNLPYMHSKDGFAFMVCSKCGVQYRTSVAVSANFRKFCSKLGSAPNRDPHYYTSSEERVKRYLEKRGLKEGLDYFHNLKFSPGEGFIIPIDLYMRIRLFNCREESLCPIRIVRKSLPICELTLRNIIKGKRKTLNGKQKEKNGSLSGEIEIGKNSERVKEHGLKKIRSIYPNSKENGLAKIQQCDKISIEELSMKPLEINANAVVKLIGECSKSTTWVENLRKGRLIIPKMNGENCVSCVLTAISWHTGLAKEVLTDFGVSSKLRVSRPFLSDKKVYYWPDFVVPSLKLIIGASPHIWHSMWARNHADERFSEAMKKIGWTVINLDEKDLNQLNKKRTEGKVLGKNPNNKPYQRSANCKLLDSLLGKLEKGEKDN